MAARIQLNDLKSIRQALVKSQSQMASLLGVSKRAVQSYEQGWRPTPLHVQKIAAMVLFLDWRKASASQQPCWEIKGCDPQRRTCCPAFVLQAGDLCWMVSGTRCGAAEDATWDRKIPRCQQCEVTKGMLTR
jgi:DNA-binding XRE family transcriptional regulator